MSRSDQQNWRLRRSSLGALVTVLNKAGMDSRSHMALAEEASAESITMHCMGAF